MEKHAVKAWSKPKTIGFYEQTRPDYNTDSVEFLLDKVGALKLHPESQPFTVVELGAGTGKFTRAVLRVFEKHSVKNVKIIATEPIEKMCEKFKVMVPNIEILQRRADDLGFPSNSADTILAAHCLHWFSSAESFSEIHRVLKPKAILGMIWNLPDRTTSWIKAIEEMLDVKFAERKMPRPEGEAWPLQIKNHGGFGSLNRETSYQYTMDFDLEGIIERYKGVSVISAAEDSEKEDMLAKIEKEMKTNPDVKDKEKYFYNYAVNVEWVQKN